MTVRQRLDDGTWSYRVRCPSCGGLILAAMAARVAFQLLLAQSPFETWSLAPGEREHGAGAAVSLMDLVSLRHDLERPDTIERLRAQLDTVER